MKNPVLHIKKGVEVYEDPHAGSEPQPPRPRAPTVRTFPRKPSRSPGRRGRLAFVPLVVVAIVLVVVFRIVPRAPTNRATMMGWNTVLRAMPYGDMLLVSVTFIQAASPGPNGPPAQKVVVHVLLPETGEQLMLSEDLMRSPTTLRGQMRPTQAVERFLATVSIGNQTRTLTLAARTRP